MQPDKKPFEERETNLFKLVRFRYLPYWPLFALLAVVCLAFALFYLKYTPPLYETAADLLIKDEKKGTDDSRMLESLNIFTTKKIVEDEIEVLQSQTLMKEVVRNLDLYAPVFEEGLIRSSAAYTTSPLAIEINDFDALFNEHIKVFLEKVYFRYDSIHRQVLIGRTACSLNQWVRVDSCPCLLRFNINRHQLKNPQKPLYFSLYNPKYITNNMLKGLNVSARSKLSSVVSLAIRDEVPQRGEDILNELIKMYNRAAINDKNQLAVNTLSFVQERLKYVMTELDSVEKQIQLLKTRNGGSSLSEQSSAFLKNVTDNDQKIADMNMQLAILHQVEKYVDSGAASGGIVPSTLGVNDPGLSQMLQKLYDARSNYEKLKRTVGENNPILSVLTNEMDKVKPNILENIRIQKLSLKAGLTNLNATNSSYASTLESLPRKERDLLESTRRETTLNNVYAFLLQKREEAELSYASTVSDSRTVNVAASSIDPVSPKRLIAVAAAFIAAMGIGVLIVSGKDFFSSRILFRRDIEKLTQFPVVAEISNTRKNKNLMAIKAGGNSFMEDQFRQLRAALGLHSKNNRKKKILVTSSISGEGKSFLCVNLALSLALSGKRTLLVDLDPSNPAISAGFGVSEEAGITDYLEGSRESYEIIRHTFQKNLFIAGTGSISSPSPGLDFNLRLAELFDYLEGIFDFVIIDTASVNLVSDPYILSGYCDITLYVIRHNYTPKGFIQLLDGNSRIKPLRNLALVFNGIRSRGIFKGQYGFDFGYGNEFFKIEPKVPGLQAHH